MSLSRLRNLPLLRGSNATNRPSRSFRRRPYRTLVIGLILLIFFLVRRYGGDPPAMLPLDVPATGDLGTLDVVRVVDGDTIIFDPNLKVRLIGVNCPESVKPDWPIEPWGPEASAFTRKFLAGGVARLEFDRERTDRFGRTLAYVWVGDRMLNEELVRAGLARWERNFNYASEVKNRFRKAQDEARSEGRGIWSEEKSPAAAPAQSRIRREALWPVSLLPA